MTKKQINFTIILMKKIEKEINDLSEHLFWDVDRSKIDLKKNKKLLIQRVLDYGLIDDWQIIYDYYGIDEIAQTAATLRDLDKKSISFISLLSNIPEEEFLCYTTKQSIPKHWDF